VFSREGIASSFSFNRAPAGKCEAVESQELGGWRKHISELLNTLDRRGLPLETKERRNSWGGERLGNLTWDQPTLTGEIDTGEKRSVLWGQGIKKTTERENRGT